MPDRLPLGKNPRCAVCGAELKLIASNLDPESRQITFHMLCKCGMRSKTYDTK
jgi:hypothetical protein